MVAAADEASLGLVSDLTKVVNEAPVFSSSTPPPPSVSLILFLCRPAVPQRSFLCRVFSVPTWRWPGNPVDLPDFAASSSSSSLGAAFLLYLPSNLAVAVAAQSCGVGLLAALRVCVGPGGLGRVWTARRWSSDAVNMVDRVFPALVVCQPLLLGFCSMGILSR